MTTNLKIVKPTTEAERQTRTTMDCWSFSVESAREWKLPPFQRGLRVGSKVQDVAQQIAASGGVLPGVICIGVLEGERFLVDGQHRREAFFMACEIVRAKGLPDLTGFADVRIAHFSSMAEMADEFARLNSHLVAMRPDDMLRALESSCAEMAKVRRGCPFIGYDQIRRGDRSPVVSMSAALRTWVGSRHDVPHSSGTSAAEMARELSEEESSGMVRFFSCGHQAWGGDRAYHKMWSSLNLIVCAWIYRRIVLSAYSQKTEQIGDREFAACLMQLSADSTYGQWLVGRHLSSRDLGPAYLRVKNLFAIRLEHDSGRRHYLPQPAWASKK